ncbi:MAG: RDD family protein [Actinomycetota bacterium]|nr:RDD family protein [Actinomycetota bacterium]
MADFGADLGGPGGVQRGARASFGIRFVALLIDTILLGIIGYVIGLILGQALGTAVQILLGLGYYAYLEGSPSGQTIGKRAMNIRVIDFNTGGAIGPTRALIRYLGRILSSIPCLLGYFWMLWDSEKQTWHDKIAQTVVVPTSDYPVTAWPG